MSLLIKALASAEKDKQAGERIADASLTLELAPVEVEQAVATNQVAIESIADDIAAEEAAPVTNSFADKYLSLAEEAGLTDAPLAAGKYAKSKSGVVKASDKANEQFNTQKNNLQAAQQAKKAASKAEKPLAVASTLQTQATQAAETNQKAAAKVFVANQAAKNPSSKYALAVIGVAGALMILLGLQGYAYIQNLTTPNVVLVKPASTLPPPVVTANVVAPVALAALPQEAMPVVPTEDVAIEAEVKSKVEAESNFNKLVAENSALKKSQVKKSKNSSDELLDDNETLVSNAPKSESKRSPVKLISRVPTDGVDPTLLAAYQAFSRGEDASAQQQYRQVLQRDVRNVDALLGMAAIAQRQGREADAQGWYQKVLEIEPRNTIAQSAMVSTQANTDAVGTESRIKSMLAQQPEAADLHASLGNLYAEQSQWPSAQEAFFNACRFAPNNADYAFNLAISLDQMGKSNLALKQYQRALELLNKSGASSPDKAQLEARIKALQ